MRVAIARFGLALALTWGVATGPAAAAPGATTEKTPAVKSNTQNAQQGRTAAQVASDVTITGKVKTALMQDKAVSANEINVDTVKGVVHLKGKVDSKAEAHRAAALARKVDGVKSVMSHLKIVPNEKTAAGKGRTVERVASDVTITGKVKTALMQDKTVSANEINVDTVKGVVHLKGKVDSKAEAQKAVALAKKVDGVKAVKSQLKVGPDEKTASGKGRTAGRVASDVTITGKVKTALMRDKTVSANEINVDTVKGIVHLKGKVDNKAEAQRAVALAKQVNGVKAVKSHLQIAPNEKTAGYRSQSGKSTK